MYVTAPIATQAQNRNACGSGYVAGVRGLQRVVCGEVRVVSGHGDLRVSKHKSGQSAPRNGTKKVPFFPKVGAIAAPYKQHNPAFTKPGLVTSRQSHAPVL